MQALSRWLVFLGAASAFVAWLVPNHYMPWTSFQGELVGSVAGGAMVVLTLILGKAATPPPASIVLFTLAAIPWLQWAAGQITFSGDALLASAYLTGAGLCVWSGQAMPLLLRDRLMRALAWAMMFAGVVSTGIALYQWFGLSGLQIWVLEGAPGQRTGANLAQANHLATLLMCALAASLLLRSAASLSSATTGLVVTMLLVGLALTQSRTPWLIFVVLFGWMLGRPRDCFAELRLSRTKIAIALCAYGLLFWAVAALPAPLLLAGGGDGTRVAIGLRPLLWHQAWVAIMASPWVGYGWQQGLNAHAASVLIGPNSAEYWSYAHNLFLDMAIWSGLPVALVVMVLATKWFASRGLRVSGAKEWFCFVVVGCIAIHSMLEFPFAYTYFLVPAAVLAGQLEPESQNQSRRPVVHWAMVATFVVLATSCVAIWRDYLLVEADRRHVMMKQVRIIGAGNEPVPDLWVLDQMRASAQAARRQVSPEMSDQELKDLINISKRFPGVYYLKQLAVAFALKGRTTEGLVELKRLRAMHGESVFRLALGEIRDLANAKYPQLRALVAQAEGAR